MFLSSLEPFTQNSVEFLNQIYQEEEEPFIHLTYASFVALSSNIASDRLEQDFENSVVISKAELRSQIAYDLCDFYLYEKKYNLAKQKVIECRDNLEILKREYADKSLDYDTENRFLFCTFTDDDLNGRLMALGIFDRQKASVLYRMNESVLNNYEDIEKIFTEDNIVMEIPLVNRRVVESNMENEVECNSQSLLKDTLIRVAALNKVRSIVDPYDLFSFNDFLGKYGNQNGLKILLETSLAHLKQNNSKEHKELITKTFYNILLTSGSSNMKQIDIELIEKSGLLSGTDLSEIKKWKKEEDLTGPIENFDDSTLSTLSDWKLSDWKSELD